MNHHLGQDNQCDDVVRDICPACTEHRRLGALIAMLRDPVKPLGEVEAAIMAAGLYVSPQGWSEEAIAVLALDDPLLARLIEQLQ